MKQKILRMLAANYLIFAFWIISVIMELVAVTVTGGNFLIRKPWIYISLMLIFTGVMYAIKNQSGRFWFSFCLLIFNFICDLVFIVIFEMTDTIFDYSMLNLRKDGMAIIESLPINFWYVMSASLLLSAYVVFGRYFIKRTPKPAKHAKISLIVTAVAMACTLALHGTCVYFTWNKYDPGNVSANKLYRNDTASYADKGILGNFFSELYKGAFFSKINLGDTEQLDSFIYREESPDTFMTGEANGYNVITILGESMEWFGFMSDTEAFPNGFTLSEERLSALGFTSVEEVLRTLYPNLYAFYDSSVVMTNFHAREKTDISENLSIMGAYPTDKFLNYDYPNNTIVTSLARTLKQLYGNDIAANAFHNGQATFYNRSEYLRNGLGFDSFTAADEMVKRGMPDYMSKGERNLDHDMIDTCHEQMFPADKRFFTYITTITQHGQYVERDNLKNHYAKLDEYGLAQLPATNDKNYAQARNFRTYAAAAMELDAAVGRIDYYLRNTEGRDGKPLIDNTVVVLFGDHNAYYSSLSSYVKDIHDENTSHKNYTDLFKVSLMMRIGNGEKVRGGEHPHTVDKFTCTADILPTIYDVLGIKTYSDLLYGHSVFDETESVLYSRAYDIFMTDKMYFSSIHKIRFQTEDADETYKKRVEEEALDLLEKVSAVNKIYYYDYLSGENAKTYYQKLKTLNGLA